MILMTIETIAIIATAGFLAGAINAAAGGGTLITFPILVWLGVPAITANISSSVGLLPGYLGGGLAYRRELKVQKARIKTLTIVSIVGGVIGAFLLLATSSAVFNGIVPFLVLASAGLLAIQPPLSSFLKKRQLAKKQDVDISTSKLAVSSWAQIGVFIGAIYGSYFGAGLGVMLLAVLAFTVEDKLQNLNGLKTLLSLLINFVGVVVFVSTGNVDWAIVGIIAPAAFLGGTIGGSLARRLSPIVLRLIVVVFAVVSGISLF